jgi:hypothetical protein
VIVAPQAFDRVLALEEFGNSAARVVEFGRAPHGAPSVRSRSADISSASLREFRAKIRP